MASETFVSVVMAIRNEEHYIARCLQAVLDQDYPADHMEIIIADGESDDATREIIVAMDGSHRLRLIANPQRIQATGLNAAIREAHGEVIVRVDGHTILAPDYIRKCLAALDASGASAVGGNMEPVGITPTGKAIAAAMHSPFAIPTAFRVSTKDQITDTVYMGAWPHWVFDLVGEFDAHLRINEDYEHNYRIRKSGGKVYLSTAIRSLYIGRQTLRTLASQYFRYGRGRTATLRKHPCSLRARHLAAPGLVAIFLAGIPLAIVLPVVRVLWLCVLVVYALANLAFSVRATMPSDWPLLWRVPLVFVTIHLAWGLGFWAGLLFGPAHVRESQPSQVGALVQPVRPGL